MARISSETMFYILVAALGSGFATWWYVNSVKVVRPKEVVVREVQVVQKPEIFPERDTQKCRQMPLTNVCTKYPPQPGPTFPPSGAAQQSLPAVPINPSFQRGVQYYSRPPGPAEQVGILIGPKEGQILPLFAQRSVNRNNRYTYWTRTGDYQPVVVPVTYKGRDCMNDEIACEIVYSGDTLKVPAMSNMEFTVSLYKDLY